VKLIFRAPSSTAHFDMHFVTSLLHKMSLRGKFVTTVILCPLKLCRNLREVIRRT
jgi:hypothetical protein